MESESVRMNGPWIPILKAFIGASSVFMTTATIGGIKLYTDVQVIKATRFTPDDALEITTKMLTAQSDIIQLRKEIDDLEKKVFKKEDSGVHP